MTGRLDAGEFGLFIQSIPNLTPEEQQAITGVLGTP